MISKELLSEVLGSEVRRFSILRGAKTVRIAHVESCQSEINIYELAYKCKEWAWKQGCLCRSETRFGDSKYGYSASNATIYGFDRQIEPSIFEDEFEHIAIFKSCEWLLKQKDNK